MSGGVHNYIWRGETAVAQYDINGDGYADPGKYAFIAEVRDRAGNVTQRLWGGTVWIQNNVLQIIQPETIGINPDPLNFSPGGNSVNKTTRFHFKVRLGITPATPADPERIEIFAEDLSWLDGVIKKVGTCTVRVYDSNGDLVRTIMKDEEIVSSTDKYADWDGRTGAGADLLAPAEIAADGDYKITVEVKDFAGNPAFCAEGGTALERWVKVDSTLPAVIDNQAGDDIWRNAPGTAYNVDFSDSGSKLDRAQYKICAAANQSGTVLKDWTEGAAIFSGLNSSNYSSDWPIDFGKCAEGTNYVSVRVYDIAGNSREASDVFYVRRDVLPPQGGSVPISINNTYGGTAGYTKYTSVNLNLSAVDQNEPNCSHVTKMKLWNDGSVEPSSSIAYSISMGWSIRDAEGSRTVYVKFGDDAGNWSGAYSASIIYDKTAPQITGISDSPDPFSPGNIDGNKDSITFSYTINETAEVRMYIDELEKYSGSKSAGSYSWDWSPGASESEGNHSYYFRAEDNAGNSRTSEAYGFNVDNTPPVISSVYHDVILVKGYTPASIYYSIYDARSSIAAVAVQIKNISGSTVATLSGGISSTLWDGKDSGGSYVVNGKYYYSVSATDSAGNSSATPQYGFIRVKSPSEILTGPGPGASQGSHLKVLKVDSGVVSEWTDLNGVYNAWYGLNVAAGDVDGDGKDEILTGPGPGVSQTPHLKILKVNNGVISEWRDLDGIYPSTYGLIVAAGDVDGDGRDEILTGPGPSVSNGSHLKIFKADGGVISEWADLNGVFSWYGLNVAAGDIDGDGVDEILAGPGPGASNGSHLKVFKVVNGVITLWKEYNDVYPGVYYGLNVGAGDVDGDGRDEILTGPGHVASNEAHLKILKFDNGAITLWKEYNDVYPGVNYGLNVAAGDVDGDGKDEILTGPGPKPDKSPHLKILKADVSGISIWNEYDWVYTAYYGLKVGAGDVPGGVTAFAVIKTQSTTLEAPVLTAPEDEAGVNSLRPTFQWDHRAADGGQWTADNYRIDLAKNDAFSIAHQTFSKTASTGSPDKDDPDLYHYTYSIHEFDPGLDRDTYYWKVTALTTNESATSEVRSFTVAPQLTLTGITNYPNPFNPNHLNPNNRTTKIRYRLGADADSVKIRIYDVTGSLVVELDGTTDGENSSIWEKYNDIEWDGRNGRGDIVVNGIYPFEVIARSGDKSVSARGKIAVLK